MSQGTGAASAAPEFPHTLGAARTLADARTALVGLLRIIDGEPSSDQVDLVIELAVACNAAHWAMADAVLAEIGPPKEDER